MLLLRFVLCVCFCCYVFVIYIVSFADVFVFVGVVCCAFVFSLLFHVLSSFCSFSLSPRLSIKSLLAFSANMSQSQCFCLLLLVTVLISLMFHCVLLILWNLYCKVVRCPSCHEHAAVHLDHMFSAVDSSGSMCALHHAFFPWYYLFFVAEAGR